MIKIAILASGSGSNAENILEYFKDFKDVTVSIVGTNNLKAGVIDRVAKFNKANPSNKAAMCVFNEHFLADDSFATALKNDGVDIVILAGFLLLVPESFIEKFDGHILNIHPSLLPRHGGKGMYGTRVHQAVLDAQDKETGITIHKVNSKFDDGEILYQSSFELDDDETTESIQEKIRGLEHRYYPEIIEEYAELLALDKTNKSWETLEE